MKKTDTSNENIAEALALLENAARQKKGELKDVISDKYSNLKHAITEAELGLSKSARNAGKKVSGAVDAGIGKSKVIATDVDDHMHRNLWSYLGGVAAASFLLGLTLKECFKCCSHNEK